MNSLATHQGLRVLLGLSCFTIVIAGLKAASDLLLPILLALFLALLCIPPMRRLEARGVPSILALVIVVVGATLGVVLILFVVGSSITRFQEQLPLYQERLDGFVSHAVLWLQARGIDVDTDELVQSVDSAALLRLVGNTASQLMVALSNLILIVLTMLFMLLEARALPARLRAALDEPDADLADFSSTATQVQRYLAIKAWVSMATGALVGLTCWIVGVDFPLLWALIAFLFNFVPNIGSIIAAVPAVLLTLLQLGPGHAAVVAAAYVVINMGIGNIIEPRLMGRKLGLSPLVVFLSMLFWGWVWGPVGMLLSVPLTVIVKILVEHSSDFRWLGALLGP